MVRPVKSRVHEIRRRVKPRWSADATHFIELTAEQGEKSAFFSEALEKGSRKVLKERTHAQT